MKINKVNESTKTIQKNQKGIWNYYLKKNTKRKNQVEEKGMQNDDQKRDGYLFSSRLVATTANEEESIGSGMKRSCLSMLYLLNILNFKRHHLTENLSIPS